MKYVAVGCAHHTRKRALREVYDPGAYLMKLIPQLLVSEAYKSFSLAMNSMRIRKNKPGTVAANRFVIRSVIDARLRALSEGATGISRKMLKWLG